MELVELAGEAESEAARQEGEWEAALAVVVEDPVVVAVVAVEAVVVVEVGDAVSGPPANSNVWLSRILTPCAPLAITE